MWVTTDPWGIKVWALMGGVTAVCEIRQLGITTRWNALFRWDYIAGWAI